MGKQYFEYTGSGARVLLLESMRIKWVDTCKSVQNSALLKRFVVVVLDIVTEFKHATSLVDDQKKVPQNQGQVIILEKKIEWYETGMNYQNWIGNIKLQLVTVGKFYSLLHKHVYMYAQINVNTYSHKNHL